MFRTFGPGRKSRLERFPVERLSRRDNLREAYRESVSNNLARLDKSFPQTTWDSIAKILKAAANKTFSLRPKLVANKGIFDSVNESMSRERTDLRLRIENTKDDMKRKKLRKRRSKILYEMRKRSLENASSFLDKRTKEIERLQMLKAVRLTTTLQADGARRV